MQNRDIAILVGIVAVIAAAVVTVALTYDDDSDQRVAVNEVIQITDFDLKNEIGLGSTAKGTIFFIDEGENLRVRVVADIMLVPEDIGGFQIGGLEWLTPECVTYEFEGDLSPEDIRWSTETGFGWIIVKQFPALPGPGESSGTIMADFVTTSPIAESEEQISIRIQIGYTDQTYTCTI